MASCFCVGPQNGEPLCPCKMRGVKIIDGRYVRTEDLGPVKKGKVFDILENIKNAEPLDDEFNKVLFDNLSDLYVTD